MIAIPERDWKYLRSIQGEMLEELSRRINSEAAALLSRADIPENEKRLKLYNLINKREYIVARCFDDWRRSTIVERCWALQKEKLLKPEHIEKLDPQTQLWIEPVR